MPDRPASERPSRGAFAILRQRDFRLFWVGACVSFIGSWVQIIAMGLFVYRETGSKEALGTIALAGGLPTTALLLFGGVVADRANKRALVMTTQTLFAATAFALAALTWSGQIRLWHLIALAFVNGAVFAVDGPARQAMVRDLVGDADLAAGVALQSAAFNVARVIGPAVGGIMYASLGPGWCFFTNGVSFAAILIAVRMIRTDIEKRGDIDGSAWAGFLTGIRELRRNQSMRHVVMLTAITSMFAFSAYSTLMPAFAKDLLGIPDTDARYGVLFSAIGAGSLIGVLLVGRHAEAGRRGALMLFGAAAFGAGLIAVAHTHRFALALPLFVVVGGSAVSQLATANTLTQTLAPEALRGRAVAVHMFAMAGLQPFGAFLAGVMAQRFGVTLTLTLGAVTLLASVAGMALFRRALFRLP